MQLDGTVTPLTVTKESFFVQCIYKQLGQWLVVTCRRLKAKDSM